MGTDTIKWREAAFGHVLWSRNEQLLCVVQRIFKSLCASKYLFCSITLFLLCLNSLCICHQHCPRSKSRSDSSQGDAKEPDGGMTIVDRALLPPSSADVYCELEGERFSVSPFHSLRLNGELLELRVHKGTLCDTTAYAWTGRSKLSGRHDATRWEALSSKTDMVHAPAFQEIVYKCKLSNAIASLLVRNFRPEVYEDAVPMSHPMQLVV